MYASDEITEQGCHNTRPLTAFVVDDEQMACDALANDLSKMENIGEVYKYSSYEDAIIPLLETQPDVVFLDVEMPGHSGFDFFESVKKRINFPFRVVFYTDYVNYMIDAIRSSAFDFLLKTYKQEDLSCVIERIIEEVESAEINKALVPCYDLQQRKLAIQTVSELLLLTIDELLTLQYNRDVRSWTVMLTDGTQHRLRQSTKADDLLALHPSLAKVSSNCIINVTYLSAIENATLRCRFRPPFDNMEIYVTRRSFNKLKEKFELI